MQRAYHIAMQGRPGPVVIALPEDMLTDLAAVPDAPRVEPAPIWPGLTADGRAAEDAVGGRAADRDRRRPRLDARARAPRCCASPSASICPSSPRSAARARSTASIPTMPARSASSPNPKLKARIENADLVLLIGGRMSEAASQGYTLFGIPTPTPEARPCPSRRAGDRAQLSSDARHRRDAGRLRRRAGGRAAADRDHLGASDARGARGLSRLERAGAARRPGRFRSAEIMFTLRRRVPDAIFTTGAGNFAIWVGRFLRFRTIEQQLGPTGGSMGFGLPAGDRRQAALSPTARRLLSPATAIS